MKYLKMLGLAAVAAMALMAFGAGSASATKLCTVATEPCPNADVTSIHAELVGEAVLETKEGTVLNKCKKSTISGDVTNGATGSPASGPVTVLTFGECERTVDVIKLGSMDVNNISGTFNGTVTVTGTEVTSQTPFGTCVFTATNLGTLLGGAPAKMSINALVNRTSGLCPAEVRWTAEYKVTSPSALYVTHN